MSKDTTITMVMDKWVDIDDDWRTRIIANVRKSKIDIVLGGKTVEEKTNHIIDKWIKKKKK